MAGVIGVGHVVLDFAYRVVVAGLERAHAGAGYLGHLLIGHLVVVAQVEHQALLVGQAQDGALQLQLNRVARDGGVGFELGRQLGPHVVDWQKKPAPLALQKAQTLVGRDAVNPGKELGILPEVFQVLPHFHEHILRQVVGIVVVDYHLAHVPVHLLLVLAHELIKRQVAAGGVLKFEEDFVVFQARERGRRAGWMAGGALGLMRASAINACAYAKGP